MSKVLEPEYYERFSCLAGDCKYTCCQEWEIALTRADYTKMRNARVSPELKPAMELSFKRRKKDATDQHYADMVLDEKHFCRFLSAEGMCRLQQECGAGVLSSICKSFPRNVLEMPGGIQRSCSTGCEQVVNLLLEAKDGLRFVEREDPTAQPLKLQDKFQHAEKLGLKIICFEQVQALCIAILQNRACSLADRVILLGLALKDIDEAIAAGSDAVQKWLARWSMLTTSEGAQAARELLADMPVSPKVSAVNSLMFAQLMEEDQSFTAVAHAVYQALGVSFSLDEEDGRIAVTIDDEKITNAMSTYAEQTKGVEHLMENVLVNYFFNEKAPMPIRRTAWDFYLAFCCMFSFIRLMAAGYLVDNPGIEQYKYAITVCSRRLFHSAQWQELAVARFHETNADTLAHMAILVRG